MTNKIFDFYLNGTVDKGLNLTQNKNKILGNLEIECVNNLQIGMDEIEDKANCTFCTEENLNANLNCVLKISNDINTTNLSFETTELIIDGTNKSIYIPKLSYINIYYEKTEEIEIFPKKKSNNNALIIGLSVGGGILVLVSVTLILLYCLKIKENKDSYLDNTNNVTQAKANDFNKSNIDLNEN